MMKYDVCDFFEAKRKDGIKRSLPIGVSSITKLHTDSKASNNIYLGQALDFGLKKVLLPPPRKFRRHILS